MPAAPTPESHARVDADTALSTDPLWWRQAVVYQIYPRSFADSNGDGLGDIKGVTSRADYLAGLGVDAVWLSPFYPSELADGGYDVADYRNVDPRLGTLDDFDEMIAALHGRGIRVIVDIVPNHTSRMHPWFQEALAAGRGSAARERYIFREGTGRDGSQPPTDWTSTFGGAAWEQVEDGQWYYHFFAREQPDLNWDHPDVREDFLTTLRFWSDRGVDGFRIDVAHGLAKDLSEPLPSQAELDAMPMDGHHRIFDRDEVQDIYATWREVFNSYDPPRTAVAEAWVNPDRVPRYANPNSLGQSFNFDLLEADFNADQFRTIITDNLELASSSGSSSTWVLSNHDVVRHATRYGLPDAVRTHGPRPDKPVGQDWLLTGGTEPELHREQGLRRARAATMLMLALPGSSYIYQGEELGLHEVAEIPADQRQDPTFFRTNQKEIGRDGCRVPLPWVHDAANFGFGGLAHLPQPSWFADSAVDVESAREDSTLSLYRRALHLRRTLQDAEEMEWVDDSIEAPHSDQVLHLRRPGGWDVITNFSTEPIPFDTSTAILTSEPLTDGVLPGETTIWCAPRS